MKGLILPVRSRIISLEEAAGFAPPPPKPTIVTRDVWKGVLRRRGLTKDIARMNAAEAKRQRKAKR